MTATALSTEPTLSTDEVAQASYHLCASRDLLIESISGLSDAQWNFTPATDVWSTADILEHLVILETRVHAIIRNLASAPPTEDAVRQLEMDQVILTQVPLRSTKVKAPDPVCPTRQLGTSEAMQQFLDNREQTIQLLGAPLLRGRVRNHPIFGPWDGYQWLLAIAGALQPAYQADPGITGTSQLPALRHPNALHDVDLLPGERRGGGE